MPIPLNPFKKPKPDEVNLGGTGSNVTLPDDSKYINDPVQAVAVLQRGGGGGGGHDTGPRAGTPEFEIELEQNKLTPKAPTTQELLNRGLSGYIPSQKIDDNRYTVAGSYTSTGKFYPTNNPNFVPQGYTQGAILSTAQGTYIVPRLTGTQSYVPTKEEVPKPIQPKQTFIERQLTKFGEGKEKYFKGAEQAFTYYATKLGIKKVPLGKTGNVILGPNSKVIIPKEQVLDTPYGQVRITPMQKPSSEYARGPEQERYFGPETVGKVAKRLAIATTYTLPVTSQLSIASDVVGAKQSVEQIRNLQPIKIESAASLNYEESDPDYQKYVSEARNYNEEIAKAKKSIAPTIIVSTIAAALPASAKAIGKLGEPILIPITKLPAKQQNIQFIAGFVDKEGKAVGKAIMRVETPGKSYDYTTPVREMFRVPRIRIDKPTRYDTGIVDIIPKGTEGDLASAYGTISRAGRDITLRKSFTTDLVTKEVSPENIRLLSKPEQFVFRKNLPGATPLEGVTLFRGAEVTTKGRPLIPGKVEVRLNRFSKYKYRLGANQRPLLGRTLVPAEKKVLDKSLSAIRVKELGSRGPVNLYKVNTGSKSITSVFPKQSGKVTKSRGLVFVKVGEAESSNIFSLGQKQATKKLEQKLAAQASQAVTKIAKTIKPISLKLEPVAEERFKSFPTYVGGLGTGQSFYYAKGRAEQVQNLGPLVIPRPVDTTTENLKEGQGVLIIPRVGERQELIPAITNRNDQTLITIPAQIPEESQVTIPAQVSRERLRQPIREDIVQRLRIPRPFKLPTPKIKIRIPKEEDSTLKKRKMLSVKPEDLFIAYTKRRGKPVAIAKGLSLQEVVSRGKAQVRQRIAASLFVRTGAGKPVPLTPREEFRVSRVNPFVIVQRKISRLVSMGERADIAASRTGGNLFFR